MYHKFFSIFAIVIILSACGGGSGGSTGSSSNGGTAPPPANNSPVANDDTFELFVNETTTFDIIANDTDSDGDSLSISSTTEPTAGQVVIVDNQIQYTPNTNFIGSDTFSYTLSDGNNATDSAIVTVTINNRPPAAENDAIVTLQSQSVSFEPLTNDSSAAQHTMVIAELTAPSNGQVALLDNVVTYVPTPGFVGQDAFAYTVRDALGDEATASVAVAVNNIVPIATADTANTQQNTSVTIEPLLNDVDAIGDTLSISGSTLPNNGTVELVSDSFTYTPEDGYAGSDSFSYTVVDNFGDTATASITIDVINTFPIVQDDSVTALENVALEINVIANDSDVTGDPIRVTSVSTPLNGTATIANNVITYQPNADYSGEDLFGYTIQDSHGASTSGFIRILISPGVKLRGAVLGQNLEGQEITVSYANNSVSTTIDSAGQYEVIVDTSSPLNLVSASVAHPSVEYTYKAYFTDIESLLEQANSELIVDGLNLSDLTTAEFELLNFIGESNTIDKLSALNALRVELVTTYQLEAAAMAELVSQPNDIELPDSYTSINEFMASPFEMREALSNWREQFPTEYYGAFDDIFNDDALTSAPDTISTGNTLFQKSVTESRPFDTNVLYLNPNSQGHYLRAGIIKTEFSWQKSESSLDIDFTETFRLFVSDQKYCGSNNASFEDFDATTMQFRHLYATPEYDVFMRKSTGNFEDSNCLDNSVHTIEYDTMRVYKTLPLNINPGQYYLESLRMNEGDEGPVDSDYQRISSLFTLNEDGTFNEEIADFTDERSGLWSVTDNTLVLDYLEDYTISYQVITSFEGVPIWSYQVLNGDALTGAGHSYLVTKDSNFTLDENAGKYANSQNALFDVNIDNLFGLNFNDGGVGEQSNLFFGSSSTSSISIFSWILEDNEYKSTYYYDTNDDQYLNFCDVSDENCYVWRQRSFEIIGKYGDNYMIKNYQEIGRDPSIPPTTRSGYIGLFSFENN